MADADRDAALERFAVSRETAARLDAFLDLLRAWQSHTNLVGPATLPQVWTRHIADSLQLLRLAPDEKVWVDLGSGAGFPGLVIAIALTGMPGAEVHLVDSIGKKAAFLREAVRLTGAPAIVHAARIEAVAAELPRRIDVVTARALAPLPRLLELAFPLLKRGARGLFLKGQDVESELTEAAKYWKIHVTRIPSATDPRGTILSVERAEPIAPRGTRGTQP